MKYQVHRLKAHHEIELFVYGYYRYFWNAQYDILRAPHAKGTIYGIYDAWNKKYLRFYHNYHPVDNPTGNIEIIKSGSY